MAKSSKDTGKKSGAVRTKGITKTQARKFLSPVPEEFVFWCNDGNTLRDLRELGAALGSMSDQTFAYHCNEAKNDFSNWIRDIIGDEKLAQSLKSVTSRAEAARIVEERCNLLVLKAG